MNYFPASFSDTYGQVPMVPHVYYSQAKDMVPFPFNVQFLHEDIVSSSSSSSLLESPFDIITCLSVTKWIHMNGGDDALLTLFGKFRDLLRPGGLLILEPQPWSSYYSKSRLDPVLTENYQHNCKIKPDQFQSLLETPQFGFKFMDTVENPNPVKGFNRPILIFSRM